MLSGRLVQLASTSEMKGDSPSVKSIAICAGAGGSMLHGVNADLYFTGEMAHVRLINYFVSTLFSESFPSMRS